LWNGISVSIAKSSFSTLARIPGVSGIYPVSDITLDEIQSSGNEPNMFSAVTMTGADYVRNTLGYTGAGVRVAVIDTGIDYTHPDLGGCFGSGCRVAKGYDFVGDAFDNKLVTTPTPDADPRDCMGHGTHVSGILGAKPAIPGGITGVAPGVTFNVYRVFGCTGSTSDDIIIAAMERALADGSDVLNISIGKPGQWPQSPTAAVATRLVNKGISVVASAGNEAFEGLYHGSAPAVGSKVISVASVDNTFLPLPYLIVKGQHFTRTVASGAPLPPAPGSFPLARTGTPHRRPMAAQHFQQAALPARSH
jgi:minor extracellular serine protease Vpr